MLTCSAILVQSAMSNHWAFSVRLDFWSHIVVFVILALLVKFATLIFNQCICILRWYIACICYIPVKVLTCISGHFFLKYLARAEPFEISLLHLVQSTVHYIVFRPVCSYSAIHVNPCTWLEQPFIIKKNEMLPKQHNWTWKRKWGKGNCFITL